MSVPLKLASYPPWMMPARISEYRFECRTRFSFPSLFSTEYKRFSGTVNREVFRTCWKTTLLIFPETQIRGNRSGKIDFLFTFSEWISSRARNETRRIKNLRLEFYNH